MGIIVLKHKIKNCFDTTKEKHLRTIIGHNLNEYSQFEYNPIVDKYKLHEREKSWWITQSFSALCSSVRTEFGSLGPL